MAKFCFCHGWERITVYQIILIKMKESEFKGDIKGFPKEIVEWMCDQQEAQGNKRDVSVFERKKNAHRCEHGFSWYIFEDRDTDIINDFCEKVISDENFDLFYTYYPKKQSELKRGDLVWVSDIKTEAKKIQLQEYF